MTKQKPTKSISGSRLTKRDIYNLCAYDETRLFWELTRDDFVNARAFFGEEDVCNWCGEAQCWQGNTQCSRYRAAGVENKWTYCLKELALTPDNERLQYLATFL